MKGVHHSTTKTSFKSIPPSIIHHLSRPWIKTLEDIISWIDQSIPRLKDNTRALHATITDHGFRPSGHATFIFQEAKVMKAKDSFLNAE
mmetsp:Transcript_39310/g.57838  ORF Transcript_39310/g.57838 Transcript_39310/m.57838 type:complete len:89 (+) Transcript_39310:290-556(+)